MSSNLFVKLRTGANSITLSLHDTLYRRFHMFALEVKVKWLFTHSLMIQCYDLIVGVKKKKKKKKGGGGGGGTSTLVVGGSIFLRRTRFPRKSYLDSVNLLKFLVKILVGESLKNNMWKS